MAEVAIIVFPLINVFNSKNIANIHTVKNLKLMDLGDVLFKAQIE